MNSNELILVGEILEKYPHLEEEVVINAVVKMFCSIKVAENDLMRSIFQVEVLPPANIIEYPLDGEPPNEGSENL